MQNHSFFYKSSLWAWLWLGMLAAQPDETPRVRTLEIVPEGGIGTVMPRRVDAMGSSVAMTPYWRFAFVTTVVDTSGNTSSQLFLPRRAGLSLRYCIQTANQKSLAISAGLHRTQLSYNFDYPRALGGGGWLQDIRYTSVSTIFSGAQTSTTASTFWPMAISSAMARSLTTPEAGKGRLLRRATRVLRNSSLSQKSAFADRYGICLTTSCA
jgi:hypothetical protein